MPVLFKRVVNASELNKCWEDGGIIFKATLIINGSRMKIVMNCIGSPAIIRKAVCNFVKLRVVWAH